MILIDSSSWIEALRTKGRTETRDRVKSLLTNGLAAWCDMVALELWNGARGEYERQRLSELEKEILCLPTTNEVWQSALRLARKCRSKGHTIPSTDLVIVACGIFHGVEIEHCDEHFKTILEIQKKEDLFPGN